MLRTISALVALATLAGCIALPEDADAEVESAAIVPDDRIDGMTAEASHTDATVDCQDGGLTIPPGFCAERVLTVVGRVGLDTLPVELVGSNGEISIRTSEDDSWSFTATVRVRALTEEMARDSLDTAWTWSHERDDGTHALVAGPAPPTDIGALGARVIATTYEVELPEWLAIDLRAVSDNGGIVVDERAMGSVDVATDNGQIVLKGQARDVRAATDNGQIVAALRPIASGEIALSTDNGQIVLKVPEGRAFGYDIDGKTDNGQVVITLRDGDSRKTDEGASFRTSRFEERSIQTRISLATDNGQAVVSPME